MTRLEKHSVRATSATRLRRAVYLAKVSADQLLADAQTEAARLLTEAREEAARLRQEAEAAGYDEGLGQWNRTVVEAHREGRQLIGQSEAAVVRLALRVAERILGSAIDEDRERILPIVRRALQEVPWGKQMKIRVAPVHYAMVRERISTWSAAGSAPVDLAVAADNSVGTAGCIVESSLGVIDARLESQLRAIEKALLPEAS